MILNNLISLRYTKTLKIFLSLQQSFIGTIFHNNENVLFQDRVNAKCFDSTEYKEEEESPQEIYTKSNNNKFKKC